MGRTPKFSRKIAAERKRALIDAGLRCLARDGMPGFTIDSICREAGVSRGLISHHFKGIKDMLVETYREMTSSMERAGREALFVDGGPAERLEAVVGAMFAAPMFSKTSLRAWLALWGEVAGNPSMKAAHRQSYEAYHSALAAVLSDYARSRNCTVDAPVLATTIIALIDGLWIEWCLDSSAVSRESAQAIVSGLIESMLMPSVP